MGITGHVQSVRRFPIAFAMLGFLIAALLIVGARANSISRRRAIGEQLAKHNLEPGKEWRIGVKQMPPMCFYDGTLPTNERFSGVRYW